MPNFFINVKEKGAKKAEKNIRGLNNALGGMASKAALAAGAYIGTGMLLSGMKQAIDLAGQQEAAEKALETALGSRSQALLDQASALQTMSVFGDEAIIQQQAFLGSLKFSEDQIKSIIPVAMDLAAATGMTLESAVRNTAKTFSGLAGELGELVPQLRGLTKEQMMAGDAVKVMGDLFGGQALAQTTTITGKMEQFKNVIGDTAEAFGEILIPPLTFVIGGLGQLAKGVEFVLDGFKSMIEPKEFKLLTNAETDLKTFKDTLETMNAGELLVFSNHMKNMQILTEEQTEKQKLLNEAMLSNSIIQEAMNLQLTERDVITSGFTLPTLKKVEKAELTIAEAIKIKSDEDKKARLEELKGIASSTATVQGEVRNQIQARFANMMAGIIEKVIGTKGLLGLALAPIAAAGASQIFNSLVPSFATGGEFVTNGEQLIRVGDNRSGRELVQITPLDGDPAPNAPQGGSVVINVSGNLLSSEYVENELAEKISDAVRRGTDFGIG
jgi:hypothetical protein